MVKQTGDSRSRFRIPDVLSGWKVSAYFRVLAKFLGKQETDAYSSTDDSKEFSLLRNMSPWAPHVKKEGPVILGRWMARQYTDAMASVVNLLKEHI